MNFCDNCARKNSDSCLDCYSFSGSSVLPSNFIKKASSKQIPIQPIQSVKEEVEHPAHYTTGKFEVIDYIMDKLTKDQFEGYCLGNILKYCSRYQLKGGYKDLAKARWYLDKLLDQCAENN